MEVIVPLRTVTVVGSLTWPRATSTTRALTIMRLLPGSGNGGADSGQSRAAVNSNGGASRRTARAIGHRRRRAERGKACAASMSRRSLHWVARRVLQAGRGRQ